MAASYPSSVKAFTTHVNVTEVIDAGHPNSIQDEVVAIESTLGTTPSVATAATASGWANTATDYTTVSGRLANIEKGVVADTHTQYIRKAGDSANVITVGSSTTKGLVIKSAVGQSVNLVEWQDSAGTILSYIDSNGNFNGQNVSSSSAGIQDVFLLMGA
jgi:hypothetical protein